MDDERKFKKGLRSSGEFEYFRQFLVKGGQEELEINLEQIEVE